MESIKPPEAPCGRTYDDAKRSTLCPHESLVKLSLDEKLAKLTPEQRENFDKIMGNKS